MTLVERLRDLQDHYSTSGKLGPENYHIFRDSADEIERLRAALIAMVVGAALTTPMCHHLRATGSPKEPPPSPDIRGTSFRRF